MILEISTSSATGCLEYIQKLWKFGKWFEGVHFLILIITVVVMMVNVFKQLTKIKSKTVGACFMLIMVISLILVTPSGYSYASSSLQINYNKFIVYVFLAFTLTFGMTMFLCGAPGLIVVFGGVNLLARVKDIDLSGLTMGAMGGGHGEL